MRKKSTWAAWGVQISARLLLCCGPCKEPSSLTEKAGSVRQATSTLYAHMRVQARARLSRRTWRYVGGLGAA
jgi:hypothetical protein